MSSKLTDLELAAMRRLLEGGSEGIGERATQEPNQSALFERAMPVKPGRQESAAPATPPLARLCRPHRWQTRHHPNR